MSLNLHDLKAESLHVITGGMKGFKTVNLILPFLQLEYTGIETQLFKPRCDYRKELYETYNLPRSYIISRTGISIPALEFDEKNPEDILDKLRPGIEVVGISEVTLVDEKKRKDLVEVVQYLREKGKCVVVDGLDRNFRREVFEPMPTLMALATTVQKFYGICDVNSCNKKGEYPQKLIDGIPAPYDSKEVEIGGDKVEGKPKTLEYEIRCLKHHELPDEPRNWLLNKPAQ